MLDDTVDNRVDGVIAVLGDPGRDVHLARLKVADVQLVAREKVGQHCEVAVRGEIIRKQLTILENAKHVAQNEDGNVRGFVILWVCEICFDCTVIIGQQGFRLSGRRKRRAAEGKLGFIPLPTVLISPVAVPSCLNPVKQHGPTDLEAILGGSCVAWKRSSGIKIVRFVCSLPSPSEK